MGKIEFDFQQLVTDIEQKYNLLSENEIESNEPTPGNIVQYFEYYELATQQLKLSEEKLASLKKNRFAINLGMLSTLSFTISLIALPIIFNPLLLGFTLPCYLLIGMVAYGIFNKEKLNRVNSFTPLLVAPFTPFILAYKLSGVSHHREIQECEKKVNINCAIKEEIESWFSTNKKGVIEFLAANYLNCKNQLSDTYDPEKLKNMEKQAKILLGIKELICSIHSNS